MGADAANLVILAIFGLGGGELIIILGAFLILIANPPPFRGPRIWWFGKGFRKANDKFDDAASGAGQSLGGVYGKPASQAIAPENKVAELYTPAVLGERNRWPDRRNPRDFLRHFMGSRRARFILLIIAAATSATLKIIAMHPVVKAEFQRSPSVVWALDSYGGAIAALVVFSVARKFRKGIRDD